MEVRCQKFVDALVELSVGLQSACLSAIEYWHPDEPPVTILFAELGDRIVEDFDLMSIDTKRGVFGLIETAMASGDSKLVTAVATGLIEAIVATASRQVGVWERISPLMGDLSRRHAEAWMA